SFRGSTHVHSPTELAIWVRNPEGGLNKALEKNNKISIMYRNPQTRANLQFRGEGRIESSQAVRDEVYSASPEREQAADPEKKGLALVITLSRVDGMVPPTRYAMKK